MIMVKPNNCGHARSPAVGICRMCGILFCPSCGSPQVVKVRKTEHKTFPGGYASTQKDVREIWPLCHACAAKTPPVYVEPAPPPPPAKYINPSITVSNKTNPVDWTEAIKLLDALRLPAYASFRKESAKGTAHEWGPFGEGTVTVSAKKAAPPKPPKPKRTPQSMLEADVEQFLREQDDD